MKKLLFLLVTIVVCILSIEVYSGDVKAATNTPYKDKSQGLQSIKGVFCIENDDLDDAGPNTNVEDIFKKELMNQLSGSSVLLASYLSILDELDPENIEAAAAMFAENESFKKQAINKAKVLLYDSNIDCNWEEVQKWIYPRSDNFRSREEYEAFLEKRKQMVPEKEDGVSNNFKGEW